LASIIFKQKQRCALRGQMPAFAPFCSAVSHNF
jgi:hypothetical protein